MSYCRFSECDVYVFDHTDGGIEIMTHNQGFFNAKTRTEAIDKLIELKNVGLYVPPMVITVIQADRRVLGETSGIEPLERLKTDGK